jgi:hypothetical protein
LINQNLHRQPVALDSVQHRQLSVKVPVTDWGIASGLNALFVTAAEFADACRDYPIVFVKAGKEPDGSDAIAPIAVMGLTPHENLCYDGGAWRVRYLPALLRTYPFCVAAMDDQRFAICVDMAYAGVNAEGGQKLFTDEGKAGELLGAMQPELEALEGQIQRTRQIGQRLHALGLLREMRFDAKLPSGKQHTVDGFLTVDDQKLTELPDAVVVELHRTGVLGLVHLHWVSLGNMQRLVEWHVRRAEVATAANDPSASA